MTWASHVGRRSALVDASPTYVREVIGDVQGATKLVRGHLDEAASRLDQDPPVWALEPIGVAGVGARPAVAVRLEHVPAGILLRTEPVDGFDPTRLSADLDLLDEHGACRLVARWDAAVDLAIPRLARRPAGQVVGVVVNRLVDELLEQLRVATH